MIHCRSAPLRRSQQSTTLTRHRKWPIENRSCAGLWTITTHLPPLHLGWTQCMFVPVYIHLSPKIVKHPLLGPYDRYNYFLPKSIIFPIKRVNFPTKMHCLVNKVPTMYKCTQWGGGVTCHDFGYGCAAGNPRTLTHSYTRLSEKHESFIYFLSEKIPNLYTFLILPIHILFERKRYPTDIL